MGNDNPKLNSNIIPLRVHSDPGLERDDRDCEVEDVSEFIVDMLDTLMKIAATKDHSLLVYFLAMARIEAMELKKPGGEAGDKA